MFKFNGIFGTQELGENFSFERVSLVHSGGGVYSPRPNFTTRHRELVGNLKLIWYVTSRSIFLTFAVIMFVALLWFGLFLAST
jgi:hypothetical protein